MAIQIANTHEAFIASVRDLVIENAKDRGTITPAEADTLAHTRLLYGTGGQGIRGACYYQAWENGVGMVDVVEIGAMAQESWVQLTGTTIHELSHVLAGNTAGHDSSWKAACVRLGFIVRPAAAGQVYHLAMFSPTVRHAAFALAQSIADGTPKFGQTWLGLTGIWGTIRPCSAGIGTRGGKSRGKGSGSRLRLYECGCDKPIKVRVASDTFAAHCDLCESPFVKVGA